MLQTATFHSQYHSMPSGRRQALAQLLLFSLLLLIFTTTALSSTLPVVVHVPEDNRNNSSRSPSCCLRSIPQQGVWMDSPPYWQLDKEKCAVTMSSFGVEATRQCLRNRTIYVIGNSVPRQMAFGLVSMLGGDNIKREGQRDLCPKHETNWGDSCHTEFAGVQIRFLYLQFMDGFNYSDRGGFPFERKRQSKPHGQQHDHHLSPLPSIVNDFNPKLGEDKYWYDDSCMQLSSKLDGMSRCLSLFFNGSTTDDVLLFSVGHAYGRFLDSNAIDTRAWISASAVAFRRHLTHSFHGTVFRLTGAQMRKHYAKWNPQVKEIDNLLWSLWRPRQDDASCDNHDDHTRNSSWFTIDQWAINKGRDQLYNDHIHFVGPLTFATLHLVLNTLCPSPSGSGSGSGGQHY